MKSQTKKLTVTVAIAAYNAEKNIKKLASSLLLQEQTNYRLNKVIVSSDVSTDQTVSIARTIKNKLLEIVDSKKRKGFSGTLINLVKTTRSDILVILNDDIIITDKLFLAKTIDVFNSDENIGLVCCNAQPLISESFISEAVRSGYKPFKRISEETRNGNNVFTADGKALCFSRKFMDVIKFPDDHSLMGNVDKFIYFSCIKSGLNYRYAKKAVMHFKCPQTVQDFTRWQTRNYKSTKYVAKKEWGALLEKEYKISKWRFRFYKLEEFAKNPLGSTVILLLGFYSTYKAKIEGSKFSTTWETVSTTKDL